MLLNFDAFGEEGEREEKVERLRVRESAGVFALVVPEPDRRLGERLFQEEVYLS